MTSSLVILLLALILLNGWMYIQQPGMIFFPTRALVEKPTDWDLKYEDISLITTDDIKLHGWYLPRQGSNKVLLFLHGNAGNISHRSESVSLFHRLGLNVFIFDYRGYGKSEGVPDEKGINKDAHSAWQFLNQNKGFDKDNIIIFGRSLGGSVATRLAADAQPGALIVESTFSSARDMANAIFPILSRLVLLRYRFNAVAYIKQVKCPVMVIHSPEDEIIPFRQGKKIYQAANDPKFFLEIKGDHNYGFMQSQPDYERNIEEFISTRIFRMP